LAQFWKILFLNVVSNNIEKADMTIFHTKKPTTKDTGAQVSCAISAKDSFTSTNYDGNLEK